jgi:drug/metabolite transporter (DMT)-like permease
MSARHLVLIVVLAAIWGGAFTLIRNAVPALGPLGLSAVRLTLAAVIMLAYLRATGLRVRWRRDRKAIAVIGCFGAALPFPLFAYGATQWSAGFLAVINATVPLWGAVIARLWLGDRITPTAILGLAFGIGGVVLLTGARSAPLPAAGAAALVAALAASLCFAVAGVATKAFGANVPAASLGTGVLIVGAAFNAPLTLLDPPRQITAFALANAALLALLASALATVLYLKLIQEIGPTRSMTVTFLIPVWGIFWSALLLDEPVTATMIAACGFVLMGTALVLAGQRRAVPAVEA